jgi:hypothetical protein
MLGAVLVTCSSPSLANGQGHQIPPVEQPDEQEVKIQREQAKRLNKDRHEALKRDTEKLLKLSTELKEYVDKSNEHVLSLDVIKKAEEIEKLAHSVREKMKGY